MRKGIKLKLGLIMGGFIVLILAAVGATFWTVGQLKSDGKVINTAGRQRMLTQKMTKEVVALLEGRAEKAEVLSTVELFDRSLKALISGDPEEGIPPAAEPEIVAQLGKVRDMWDGFKGNIEGLVEVNDERNKAYNYIMSRNTALLELMNEAVGAMERHGLDPRTINLAGRQRMLTQKMAKEALALERGAVKAGDFLATVALFDKTLKGLISGDAELGLKPVRNRAVLSSLRKVTEEWEPFMANTEALVEVTKRGARHSDYIMATNVPLLKEMNTAVGLYEASSARKVSTLKTMQLVILVITLVVFGAAWLLLNRMIISPVKRIAGLTRAVAEGDLTAEDVAVRSNDELGELGRCVNEMKENLNRMISGIRSAAMQVSSASEQLALGNTEFSQRVTEQSSSLEETASTMEEISAGVQQNADTCREANKLAMDCRNKAEEGGTVMGRMMRSIEEINQSSKKISDIINVIEEIAFQTNLLALNAAVEAARAGEQGKGFAVVAVEVRNLAHRSSQAAKEITALIKENLTKAETGTQFAEMTHANLEEMITSVKKVTDLIAEISAASQEQASGIEQVNRAVSQLDQVTQQNAALVEESSTTSEEMSAQAGQLLQLVSSFKVTEGSSRAGEPAQEHGLEGGSFSNVTPIRPSKEESGGPPAGPWRPESAGKAVGDEGHEFVEM